MTPRNTRAPSSSKFKPFENGLFEDVSGLGFCNHFKIYTHVDLRAGIIDGSFIGSEAAKTATGHEAHNGILENVKVYY